MTRKSLLMAPGSRLSRAIAAVMLALTLLGAMPAALLAKDKKAPAAAAPKKTWLELLDISKIVWPNPPAITRIKYLNYFSSEKLRQEPQPGARQRTSWMDRMAGGKTPEDKAGFNDPFVLWRPYGMAVDHAGKLYIADGRVGAIFIFDTETKDCQLIKSGIQVRFGDIVGLAMDDDDTLYVSDSALQRVVIFNSEHRLLGTISQGMSEPAGIAIDTQNRFLYVVDTALDQVLVYDIDTRKLLRRIGTTGKEHHLTSPGNFAKPTNIAVDRDGNIFVTDTLNDRVEMFDADGRFIRTWGQEWRWRRAFWTPEGNRRGFRRPCVGGRCDARHNPDLHPGRRIADALGRPWQPAWPVLCHRRTGG